MSSGAEICVDLFRRVDMPLGPGMSSTQLDQVESDYGFVFDIDHRELLSLATPLDDGWLDWRTTPTDRIKAMLAWPAEGVLWDAHNNDFWPRAWGRRPKRPEDLDTAVLAHLADAPKLVPIFGHRFIAAGPSEGGAPVFSVYQTDVVYYGNNLPDYVAHELQIPARFTSGVTREIPFWSRLAEQDRRFVGRSTKSGRAFWNRSISGESALATQADGDPISYRAHDDFDRPS